MNYDQEISKLQMRDREMESSKLNLRPRSFQLMRKLRDENLEQSNANSQAECSMATEYHGQRTDEETVDQRLAYNLSEAKREEICRERDKKQLWEYKELVELKTQIRNAYFTKALNAQLSELKALKAKQNSDSQERRQEMLKRIEEFELQEQALQREAELRKKEYRTELHQQINIGHQQKMMEENELRLLDKQMTEAAVQTIIEEDKLLSDRMRMKRKEEIANHRAHLRARAMMIVQEQEKEEEENKKIQDYVNRKAEFEKRLEEINRKKEEAKFAAQEKVLSRVQQLQSGREEREWIAEVLNKEVTRQREENEARRQKEEILRRAQEMKETVECVLRDKLARIEAEKKMNDIYREKMNQEIEANKKAERDEIERMKEKKRLYGAELRAGMERINKTKDLEKLQMAMDQMVMERKETDLRQKIAEERRRFINEHGPQLLGYLPKKLLTKDDLPHLNQELKDYFDP